MNKGFTIIELLIVITITVLIAAVAVPIYGNFQSSSQLNASTSQIIQAIRSAQSQSMGRINGSKHGVKFNTNDFVLYQGNSYVTRNTDFDRVTTLDSILTITTDLANDEINFSLGLGEPNNTGVITLSHEIEGVKQITINELGIVDN